MKNTITALYLWVAIILLSGCSSPQQPAQDAQLTPVSTLEQRIESIVQQYDQITYMDAQTAKAIEALSSESINYINEMVSKDEACKYDEGLSMKKLEVWVWDLQWSMTSQSFFRQWDVLWYPVLYYPSEWPIECLPTEENLCEYSLYRYDCSASSVEEWMSLDHLVTIHYAIWSMLVWTARYYEWRWPVWWIRIDTEERTVEQVFGEKEELSEVLEGFDEAEIRTMWYGQIHEILVANEQWELEIQSLVEFSNGQYLLYTQIIEL